MRLLKLCLLLLLSFFSVKTYTQTLGDYFFDVYSKKQLYDKKLDSYITIKSLYHNSCKEPRGYNEKINDDLIFGVKRLIFKGDPSPIGFYYIYNIKSKEIHVFTSWENNPFEIKDDIRGIYDIHIFDSLFCRQYYFSVSSMEIQRYNLKKYKCRTDNDYMQNRKTTYVDSLCIKRKDVYSTSFIYNFPPPPKIYVKIDKRVTEYTLEEYLKLIDLLKADVETGQDVIKKD